MRGDERQHSPRLQGIDRFGEEIIVQREFPAVVVELEVRERDVADDGIDAVFREFGIAEAFNTDVVAGMDCFGDAAGDGIEFDADEPLSWLAVARILRQLEEQLEVLDGAPSQRPQKVL